MTDFIVSPDHPALPGHFPGDPLLPGVVLLDHLCERIEAALPGQRVAAIETAKFLRPLRPSQSVNFAWDGPHENRLGFTCTSDDQVVARGTVRLT